jgi:hypothetical protein
MLGKKTEEVKENLVKMNELYNNIKTLSQMMKSGSTELTDKGKWDIVEQVLNTTTLLSISSASLLFEITKEIDIIKEEIERLKMR